MTKWEYCTIILTRVVERDSKTTLDLGLQGWELVQVLSDDVTCWFKRPILPKCQHCDKSELILNENNNEYCRNCGYFIDEWRNSSIRTPI